MGIEGKYALLSVQLQGRNDFVKRPEYLKGLSVLLNGAGISTLQITPGLISARFGSSILPITAVDSEDFFMRVNPVPKYKVAYLTPKEWVRNQLIVVDGNWAYESFVADATLQALFFQGKFDRKSHAVDMQGIPEAATTAANHFLAQGLVDLHRGKWYEWLEQGIN